MPINLRKEDVKVAHDVELSGKLVRSLRYAPAARKGILYIVDQYGHALCATPDELDVLLHHVKRDE